MLDTSMTSFLVVVRGLVNVQYLQYMARTTLHSKYELYLRAVTGLKTTYVVANKCHLHKPSLTSVPIIVYVLPEPVCP